MDWVIGRIGVDVVIGIIDWFFLKVGSFWGGLVLICIFVLVDGNFFLVDFKLEILNFWFFLWVGELVDILREIGIKVVFFLGVCFGFVVLCFVEVLIMGILFFWFFKFFEFVKGVLELGGKFLKIFGWFCCL